MTDITKHECVTVEGADEVQIHVDGSVLTIHGTDELADHEVRVKIHEYDEDEV